MPLSSSKRGPQLRQVVGFILKAIKSLGDQAIAKIAASSMANLFSSSHAKLKQLIKLSRQVAKGASLKHAGIDEEWMKAFGKIARRCRDDNE
jgi:hypothetical protein